MEKTCEAIKLTKRVVDAAAPIHLKAGTRLKTRVLKMDETRQRLYFDTELHGFGLCVGAGAKTYFAQRSVRGRSRRVTIGRHGVFTVDQARRRAQQLLGKMADGVDPVDEKRKARARGFTLRQALALCEQTLKTKKRSDKTISGYRYAIATYLKDWLDRPLAEITRDEVQQRHLTIAEDVAAGRYAGEYANGRKRKRSKNQGQPTANSAMVAFRAVYNRALRGHPELPANPCINIDWFVTGREKKELPLSQLHKWHRHVLEMDNPIRRDYLLFTLHTGLRRQSATEVRWEHADFERGILRVPKPKGGRAFDLPLSDHLIRLLKARRKENDEAFGDSPWAFPADSGSGHIAEPREEFDGVEWTPHDLRRWFITAAESLDLSAYVIKSLVNHRLPSGDVTAGYIQHEVERLRPAMEMIGAKLRALCEPAPAAKVLPLRKQAAKGAR
jgi:integrase